MSQVVIENPIINSPFDEPTRHFRFSALIRKIEKAISYVATDRTARL
jgi:hypothetical protein